jgi:hypothetical protein
VKRTERPVVLPSGCSPLVKRRSPASDQGVGVRVRLPRALLDPGLPEIDVDVLAFALALLPDRGFGDSVGGQDGRSRRSGLHHRLAHRLLAGERHLATTVLDGHAGIAQDVVGDLAQVVFVVDRLIHDHVVSLIV